MSFDLMIIFLKTHLRGIWLQDKAGNPKMDFLSFQLEFQRKATD